MRWDAMLFIITIYFSSAPWKPSGRAFASPGLLRGPPRVGKGKSTALRRKTRQRWKVLAKLLFWCDGKQAWRELGANKMPSEGEGDGMAAKRLGRKVERHPGNWICYILLVLQKRNEESERRRHRTTSERRGEEKEDSSRNWC